MAHAVLAVLLLLQAAAEPAAQPPAYRTGPAGPPPPAYRVGPGADQTDTDEPGYAIAAEAATPTPVLSHTGVSVDAYDRRIEDGRLPDDRFYEATVLGGAAIAQGRQGSLDGAWMLGMEGGAALYAFQLVESGDGLGVEGAWRNVNASRRSGFVLVAREGGRTTLRFFEPGGSSPIVVTLEASADGAWRGQMTREGALAPVVMRRR